MLALCVISCSLFVMCFIVLLYGFAIIPHRLFEINQIRARRRVLTIFNLLHHSGSPCLCQVSSLDSRVLTLDSPKLLRRRVCCGDEEKIVWWRARSQPNEPRRDRTWGEFVNGLRDQNILDSRLSLICYLNFTNLDGLVIHSAMWELISKAYNSFQRAIVTIKHHMSSNSIIEIRS